MISNESVNASILAKYFQTYTRSNVSVRSNVDVQVLSNPVTFGLYLKFLERTSNAVEFSLAFS